MPRPAKQQQAMMPSFGLHRVPQAAHIQLQASDTLSSAWVFWTQQQLLQATAYSPPLQLLLQGLLPPAPYLTRAGTSCRVYASRCWTARQLAAHAYACAGAGVIALFACTAHPRLPQARRVFRHKTACLHDAACCFQGYLLCSWHACCSSSQRFSQLVADPICKRLADCRLFGARPAPACDWRWWTCTHVWPGPCAVTECPGVFCFDFKPLTARQQYPSQRAYRSRCVRACAQVHARSGNLYCKPQSVW